ncbi:DUF883 family protein [Caballeronia arationis]|uniref:DUF883 family protein n=1 Tax=Caballeronia arationis TaxID=1777142 RepID=UPI002E12EFA4
MGLSRRVGFRWLPRNPETRDRLATVKDKLSGAQGAVKEKYRVVTDSTDDFVHENPWKSIALAAVGAWSSVCSSLVKGRWRVGGANC